MKHRVIATDTYSIQHSPSTCNKPVKQAKRDGDFTTRKLSSRGEGSTPSALSSQAGNSMLHLYHFDTNDGDWVFFLCLLFLSARQGQRGKNHNSGEGCAPSYWHSCILQSRPRYCPTVVGVSPIASTALLLRTSRCHFALLTVYSTKGYTTSSRAPSSHSHLGICFRRVWLKSWYAVKLQNAIS